MGANSNKRTVKKMSFKSKISKARAITLQQASARRGNIS